MDNSPRRVRVGIYRRISRDPEGQRLGVERQRQDLEDYVAARGYAVFDRYEDNDISASTRSTKRREDYERLMKDARAGHIDVVVAYTSARLTRRPRENEDLIELSERFGVRYEYLRSPAFDLNTADGRNVARILAANDAAESERIAERVARAARQRAQDGKIHGGAVPFGFTRDYEPHPEHAAWVQEAARRVLAGETLYGICADWHRGGRQTKNGVVWRSRTLKRILTAPSVVGLRSYNGELFDAQWPAILDRETWDRLRELLSDEARQIRPWPGHSTTRKYPLVGLLRCGLCDHVMHSMTASRGGPPAYFCSTQANGGCGKLRIAMPPLEDWILQSTLAVVEGLTLNPQEDHHDEASAARAALLRAEAALEQIDSDHYDGHLERSSWQRQRARMTQRIEQHRDELARAASLSVRTMIPASAELTEQWAVRDALWKHTILSAIIDHVVIAPFPSGITKTLTRRRAESDSDLSKRRQEHLADVLQRRVKIVWRA